MASIFRVLISIFFFSALFLLSSKSVSAAIIFSDNFDRSTSSTLGSGWVEDIGNWSINSNQLVTPIQSEAINHNTNNPISANYYVQVEGTASTTDDFIAVLARFTDANNFYLLQSGKGYAQLWKRVNGTWTILFSGPFTRGINTANTYRIEVSGNQISGFINGTLVASATDNSIANAGTGGLKRGGSTGSVIFDNYEIGTISNPAPTPTPIPSNTFFSDNFDRSSTSTIGNGWIESQGDWSINSNQLVAPNQVEAVIHNTATPPSADYYVQVGAMIGNTNDFPSVLARYIDSNNFYLLQSAKGIVELWKRISGNWIPLDSELLPSSANIFHILRLEVKGNELRGYVDGAQVIYATDSSLTNAGYGGLRRGGNNGQMIFDNFSMGDASQPQNTTLNVPDIKQYSAPWGDDEYDSARKWKLSNPTISRWGCALTSAAMILDYYNHSTNPGDLNMWLNSQPDGYLSNANLNWKAISRYSKLNADNDSPKLEYLSSLYNAQTVNTELEANRPVITRLPNPMHFVTIKGKAGSDFTINDPGKENFRLLSQSAATHSSPDALRLFRPSNTDLSYLSFYVNPDITIQVLDSDGNILSGIDWRDRITDSRSDKADL